MPTWFDRIPPLVFLLNIYFAPEILATRLDFCLRLSRTNLELWVHLIVQFGCGCPSLSFCCLRDFHIHKMKWISPFNLRCRNNRTVCLVKPIHRCVCVPILVYQYEYVAYLSSESKWFSFSVLEWTMFKYGNECIGDLRAISTLFHLTGGKAWCWRITGRPEQFLEVILLRQHPGYQRSFLLRITLLAQAVSLFQQRTLINNKVTSRGAIISSIVFRSLINSTNWNIYFKLKRVISV